MAHTVEIVDTKDVSDQAHAVLVRCCNDPKTDSWHTIYWAHDKTEDELKAEVARHALRVAQQHEGKNKSRVALQRMKGTSISHDEEKLQQAADKKVDARPPEESRGKP